MKTLKPLLSSLLLSASCTVYAGGLEAVAESPAFDGFYISGSIGAQNNGTHDLYDCIGVSRTAMPPQSASRKSNSISSKTEVSGALLAGYGQQIGDSGFYLGGQAGVNLGRYKLNSNHSYQFDGIIDDLININSSADLEMNSAEFIADFKPGFVFGQSKDMMVYALTGIALSQATAGISGARTDDTKEPLQVANRVKQNITGLRLGAGFEKMLSDSWSVGFNYVYTHYGRSVGAGDKDENSELRMYGSMSSQFRKHAAMLTVSRYFA